MMKSERIFAGVNSAQVEQKCSPNEDVHDIHFTLRDEQHHFIMTLEAVLSCLRFAERDGDIPALPLEWWQLLQTRYRQLN
ncbi:Uncharacterised protein [Serratia grimesii]|uniref:hypothetical protein n=1 Tax=Serratia grimesii TaxID=82995 RepID=UPI0021C4F5CC|nr:hypothetical protein [Serratia grimesii]CAI2793506.1 Uncharacterised protein [Serratia grimesii]